MRKLECPAWGKKFNKFKRLNHFEAKCPKSNAIHSVDVSSKKFRFWDDFLVTPVGVTLTTIRNPKNRKHYSVEFIGVKQGLTPLLGLKAVEAMRLVKIKECQMERVSIVSITDKFSNVFEDLGTIQGQLSLKLDESVQPLISPSSRIPVALQPKVKAELVRLKSGDMRSCLHPCNLNKALKREHYQILLLEDTRYNMSLSKVFAKLDVKSAYCHCELDESSSQLTTFQSPFCLYRWRRLVFGPSVSSKIFRKKILEAVSGLKGV
ncbi:unnamed protein product [Lepeophtheirus salmonis]|uniref:(salmon louse) hypothetical protein n=1 Tax=Lepeophtheirus salmonis TaxID=72036 RepID=A0A7R8H1N8_LEPSM|nr:unnamed protein product [Lepeophtheirus salmonis]CAF2815500.1 unnamed protein product [Lepeophtheirus salmonis]